MFYVFAKVRFLVLGIFCVFPLYSNQNFSNPICPTQDFFNGCPGIENSTQPKSEYKNPHCSKLSCLKEEAEFSMYRKPWIGATIALNITGLAAVWLLTRRNASKVTMIKMLYFLVVCNACLYSCKEQLQPKQANDLKN